MSLVKIRQKLIKLTAIILLSTMPVLASAYHYCAKVNYPWICGTYYAGLFKMGVKWSDKQCSQLGAMRVVILDPNLRLNPFIHEMEFCHAR